MNNTTRSILAPLDGLIAAIRALDNHRLLMVQRYGDGALRRRDSVAWLNDIEARQNDADKARTLSLLKTRAYWTQLASIEEIDQALDTCWNHKRAR